jgi:hypothetical protein
MSKFNPKARTVSVTDEALTIGLMDGRTISQPLAWTPRLVHASTAQRANYRIQGGGVAVCWPDVDADVCIDLMLTPYDP